jgi:hypothetical protein
MKVEERKEEVFSMTALTAEQEVERFEELDREATVLLEKVDARKDLKEKRGIIKQTLYDGSKKLKHIIPKGKHL